LNRNIITIITKQQLFYIKVVLQQPGDCSIIV